MVVISRKVVHSDAFAVKLFEGLEEHAVALANRTCDRQNTVPVVACYRVVPGSKRCCFTIRFFRICAQPETRAEDLKDVSNQD